LDEKDVTGRAFLLGTRPLCLLLWVKMHQDTRTTEPWLRVKTLRLSVVESHTRFAAMLREVPLAEPEIRIVGTAETKAEAIHARENTGGEVQMLDLMLPERGGLERIRKTSGRENPARIVFCGATTDPVATTALRPVRSRRGVNRRTGAGGARTRDNFHRFASHHGLVQSEGASIPPSPPRKPEREPETPAP